MSTQAIIALSTPPILAPRPDRHVHHRYDAARLARTWRKARRQELASRWLRGVAGKPTLWDSQAAGPASE